MEKKGLILYDSIYSSTAEVAHWIKAIIGYDKPVDVKHLKQVLTVKPYDYVIIGSHTRMEKMSKKIYKFLEEHKGELGKKDVAYFICCGDYDETMVLQAPGQKAHPIGGRNYIVDVMEKFSNIKPVALGGFGGRHVFPTLSFFEDKMIKLVSTLAKEGALPYKTQNIWDSLVVERVECFANEVRQKILKLPALEDAEKYRNCWNTPQPASINDEAQIKFTPLEVFKFKSNSRTYVKRSRIKASIEKADELTKEWAKQRGIKLSIQQKTDFNIYYHGEKQYNKKKLTIHFMISTFPEDPGHAHIQIYSFNKPKDRKMAEDDINLAEEILWDKGRKARV